MSIEKSSEHIKNRTRDLQAFSIVPQPNTLFLVPLLSKVSEEKYANPDSEHPFRYVAEGTFI
jgi:hypothetical protein